MITIDQLLESMDLDFETKWVTKDKNGRICLWGSKPIIKLDEWLPDAETYTACFGFSHLKLSEFDGKDWTECIYEVPQAKKTTDRIEKLDGEFKAVHFHELNAFCITGEAFGRLTSKINELVDAVNELKAKFALPTLNPDLTDEDLRKMMRDPKYWRDKDSATIQKVQDGFNKLYGDKN